MIRTRIIAWVFLTAVVAASLGAQESAAQASLRGGRAVTVNDDVISTYDVDQRVRYISGVIGITPTAQNRAELEQQALEGLISDRLQLQAVAEKARKYKQPLVADDAAVDQEMTRIAQRGGLKDAAEYIQRLAVWGVDAASERERLRADISWRRWITGYYRRFVRVGASQIDASLEQQAEAANKPGYWIYEIFLDASRTGGVERGVELGTQLIGQLQNGARFASVASQFSALPTAANGGDAGWLALSDLHPKVAEQVEKMQAGQMTARPIPVENGAYIVLVREKRAGASVPMATLKLVEFALPSNPSPVALATATERLMLVKSRATGCGNFESAATGVEGVATGGEGETEISQLSPAFRTAVENLAVDQISEPVRSPIGLHLIAVCSKRNGAVSLPSRDEVLDNLESQQLMMISRRELQQLRSAAIIEQR